MSVPPGRPWRKPDRLFQEVDWEQAAKVAERDYLCLAGFFIALLEIGGVTTLDSLQEEYVAYRREGMSKLEALEKLLEK